MELGIEGRVALIGGSSKGLGKATAIALAREGVKVVICARGAEELTRTASEIASATSEDRVLFVQADLSKHEDVNKVVRFAVERFGRLDILVNNAGGPPQGIPSALTDDQWLSALDLNFFSTVRLCRAALPYMRRQQWGRIINFLSFATKEPVNGLALSTAARLAVIGFAKSLADEVAIEGVTVNSILTGYILTGRSLGLFQSRAEASGKTVDEIVKQNSAAIPAGRLGRPEEMADLALFLASDRATYITGASIPIDGGILRAAL